MKRKRFILILALFCTFFCISCKKVDYTIDYKASMTFHFSNAERQSTVNNLINSFSGVWIGSRTYTNESLDGTDKQALNDFGNSISIINSHLNTELLPYFEESDTIIYTLERTTTGYTGTVKKVQYTIDGYMPL